MYASFDKFKSWFAGASGRRLDDYMQEIKDSSQEELIEDALKVASHELDRVFESIGYTIPIDVTLIVDATVQEEARAWLEKRCIDLAALELSIGVLNLPDALEDQAKRTLKVLDDLRGDDKPHFGPRGRYRFLSAQGIPGLPVV